MCTHSLFYSGLYSFLSYSLLMSWYNYTVQVCTVLTVTKVLKAVIAEPVIFNILRKPKESRKLWRKHIRTVDSTQYTWCGSEVFFKIIIFVWNDYIPDYLKACVCVYVLCIAIFTNIVNSILFLMWKVAKYTFEFEKSFKMKSFHGSEISEVSSSN